MENYQKIIIVLVIILAVVYYLNNKKENANNVPNDLEDPYINLTICDNGGCSSDKTCYKPNFAKHSYCFLKENQPCTINDNKNKCMRGTVCNKNTKTCKKASTQQQELY